VLGAALALWAGPSLPPSLAGLKEYGAYFVLLTISFAGCVSLVSVNWMDLTNGPLGIPGVPPVEIALPQVAMAAALILPLTLIIEHPTDGLVHVPASGAAWFSVLWLGVLGSGVAYLLYFRLIRLSNSAIVG